ncbi:hypothetical protein VMCG_00258 [Cytospora schulzeri]|uniref:Uncharacterized protein n=1 Tax=Cytospora schulzeri TaxID=448051 RepID=A0A423XA55_9PEZI|nr:hypothetical protein VMCG_00258 [Valsa malicola]
MAEPNGARPNNPGVESPTTATSSRPRGMSVATKLSDKVRDLSKTFEESNPPPGFMAASSGIASSAVVAGDTSRRNSVNSLGHTPTRRTTMPDQSPESVPRESAEFHLDNEGELASGRQLEARPVGTTAASGSMGESSRAASDEATIESTQKNREDDVTVEPFDNGYHFPPSYPKGEAFKHGVIAFLQYCMTPLGFGVLLYGLNVVAWGGMLFLLLCNASQAMCYPDCNAIDSPRRRWIEYDSQVLTALFSLTAFGLAPWRFRDLYYLMMYRILGRQDGLRRLGGIHRDWFRMPGSSDLPVDISPENIEDHLARGTVPESAVPFPAKMIPEAPLTGVRAQPTPLWKMDFMIWMMVGNTLFQCVLSGFMWGMNRYDRPSWSTGLFVALGCIVAGIGGIMMFIEGKNVKGIEGVPLTERDRARLERDHELGILHYNNLKDKPLAKEKGKMHFKENDQERV